MDAMIPALLASMLPMSELQTKPDLSVNIATGVTLFIKGSPSLPVEADSSTPGQSVYLGYPHGPKTSEYVPDGRMAFTKVYKFSGDVSKLRLRIPFTPDAMLCKTDEPGVISSTFGNPTNVVANAVYYRDADTLVSVDGEVRLEGNFMVLHLRRGSTVTAKTDYVTNHLGYFLWDPARGVYQQPVVGWCSWAAYGQGVSETNMKEATDFVAKNLLPYGYNIVQMDDGYQRTPQSGAMTLRPNERYSEYWTKPNEKFGSGLASLATYIKGKGITPGIWVGLYTPLGLHNSKDYIVDTESKPYKGPWVNYAMDGLKPGADEAYFETIRDLKKQGWNYFKIDTLRHVLYDNYRKNPFYFKFNEENMEESFRAVFSGVRNAAGGSYVLACWGTMPELAGLPMGARIGEDVGPDIASMRRSAKYIAQFHHLNNIVWRNDPDYMCLRLDPEVAKSWASMVSLAGGQLMVSDKPNDYTSPHLEIMKRVSPTVFSRPMNVKQEQPDPEFFTMHCNKGDENWTVVSHHAWAPMKAKEVSLHQVGLEKGKYLAFDFWDHQFLGVVDSRVPFRGLAEGHCQVVGLRPLLDRPQLLGTDRHISQGAYDIDAMKWDAAKLSLSGTYRVGPGQRWKISIYVPKGYVFGSSDVKGIDTSMTGQVLTLVMPMGNGASRWSVTFKRA